jgi:hypothetical protein
MHLVDFLKTEFEPIGIEHHRTTHRHKQNQQNKAASASRTRAAAAKAEAFLEKVKDYVEQKQFQ